MSKKKQKYYTVWIGNKRGVYNSWEECKKAIEGVKGAKYKSFDSLVEARKAFDGDYRMYYGQPKGRKDLSLLSPDMRPIVPSVSVDAACAGNPGKLQFRGVETDTGALFFEQGPFPEGTVNIGEFLAIVWALALLKKAGSDLPIYSDSVTAIKWVKNKKINTKLECNNYNRKLFIIVEKALEWLRDNTYSNQIIKWDTELWGEIPADYGRK